MKSSTIINGDTEEQLLPSSLAQCLRDSLSLIANPAYQVIFSADEALNPQAVLRNPSTLPRLIIAWDGMAPIANRSGVIKWLFSAWLQLPSMLAASSITSRDYAILNPSLHAAIIAAERDLRSIVFTSANADSIGLLLESSEWVEQEGSLIGHRLSLSIAIAAPSNPNYLEVNLPAYLQSLSHQE